MVRKHLRFTLSVGVVLGADGIAGKGVFLNHLRFAVRALTDDQRGIYATTGEQRTKPMKHAIANVILVSFHAPLRWK